VKEKDLRKPRAERRRAGRRQPHLPCLHRLGLDPTIRGRDTGIWAGVQLDTSGPVTIANPFVTTTTGGDVTIEATLRNHDARPWTGTFSGHFRRRGRRNSHNARPILRKDHQAIAARSHPKLWWPAGYGDPNLYDVTLLSRNRQGAVPTPKPSTPAYAIHLYRRRRRVEIFINGRRFIGRGGNWGFPESMLRYRAREYDAAVRYHRDMNFTMIRNWVGQTGDDASMTPATATASWCGRTSGWPTRSTARTPTITISSCATSATPFCAYRNHPSMGPLLRPE